MDRFYNAPETVIDDVLSAVASSSHVRIADPDSGLHILLRSDWERDVQGRSQVAVLSGGGGGHEPAHAGYIGEGMLTGAISGSLFASPSVEAVLAAIREVCGEAGCLLVVKNYTGDRLNFGLAAERARSEGLEVEMVIVADDVALADAVQARGIAGTVLVHKLAGYLADRGTTLGEIQRQAERLCQHMGSLGMALSAAAQPGQKAAERAPELGLGIHNESGTRQVDPRNAEEAMQLVLEPLRNALADRHLDAPWIAMLNDLGSCSTQEMGVLSASLLRQLGRDRVTQLIGPAPLMTSLDMHGFSITLLTADELFITALDAPTTAPAWPGLRSIGSPDTFSPDTHQDSEALADDSPQDDDNVQALERVIAALRDARDDLDALDAKSGDGDAGASMQSGADSLARAIAARRLDTAALPQLFAGIGQLLSRDMGGSSGVLLSIFFTATSAALNERGELTAALGRGVERMQDYGGARPGDRTMLDALIPAVESLQRGESLAQAAQAARDGAQATATLTRANAGRSAYVPESALKGVVDPGAEAVARVFEALSETA